MTTAAVHVELVRVCSFSAYLIESTGPALRADPLARATQEEDAMTVSLINPDGHVKVPLYHHVAVATGTKQVHIAGQVSWDENGELVAPGDLAGQVAQVYRNVAKSLAAAGATYHDVVRITW